MEKTARNNLRDFVESKNINSEVYFLDTDGEKDFCAIVYTRNANAKSISLIRECKENERLSHKHLHSIEGINRGYARVIAFRGKYYCVYGRDIAKLFGYRRLKENYKKLIVDCIDSLIEAQSMYETAIA